MTEAPILEVRDLAKFYGSRLGCADVSFDLFEGEVLAIVGESGSGKSTLSRMISRLIDHTAGEVIFDVLKTPIHADDTILELRWNNFNRSLFPALNEGLAIMAGQPVQVEA